MRVRLAGAVRAEEIVDTRDEAALARARRRGESARQGIGGVGQRDRRRTGERWPIRVWREKIARVGKSEGEEVERDAAYAALHEGQRGGAAFHAGDLSGADDRFTGVLLGGRRRAGPGGEKDGAAGTVRRRREHDRHDVVAREGAETG